MSFKQLLPLRNLNFQMNRVLTHGAEACREEELLEIAPKLREFDPKAWFAATISSRTGTSPSMDRLLEHIAPRKQREEKPQVVTRARPMA